MIKPKQIRENISATNMLITTGTNNALKCSSDPAEKEPHRQTKFWIANFCWKNSLNFATEVVFKDNQRADVVIKDWMVAVEVLSSEDMKTFRRKNYPLPTVPVCVDMTRFQMENMLEDVINTNGLGADYYIKRFEGK